MAIVHSAQRLQNNKQQGKSDNPNPVTGKDWSLLISIWLGLLVISICNTAHSAQIDYDRVKSGELYFLDQENRSFTPSVAMYSDYDTEVTGLISQTRLEQQFHNSSTEWREAVYVFPLPDDAAVYRMEMLIGDRVIVAEIKEKEEAEKTYQQAKQAGQKAAVVHQQRPNMFTHKIANIAPNETITIRLYYQHNIRYHAGQFSLSLPLTITPRYMPGSLQLSDDGMESLRSRMGGGLNPTTTGWATPTDEVPDADKISPLTVPEASLTSPSHKAAIHISINAGLVLNQIESISHDVDWRLDGTHYQVDLKQTEVPADRDFVLTWQTEDAQRPQAAVFKETSDQATYAQIMLVPPLQEDEALTLPREMIWVIDTSGSMEGVSIEQARQALSQALGTLTPKDRFNVIEFNSDAHALFPQAVPAQQAALRQARSYVSSLRADGGTEISRALQLALQGSAPAGYVRQVIFLTDGSVGNETALFQQINQDIGDSRLFTVGIGSAPNRFFMRKAAQFGRGSYSHINDLNEVQQKITDLMQDLRYPNLRDIQLKDQESKSLSAEMYPEKIPDLYHGDPIMVLVKLEPEQAELPLKLQGYSMGFVTDQQALWTRGIDLAGAAGGKGIGRAWAREKIAYWMDQKTLGTPQEEVKKQVLPLALEFQLMSAYTSFVAVDKTPVRPNLEDLKTTAVPNLLAKGMSNNMARFPKTATPSLLHLQLGAALLVVGLLLMGFHRRPKSETGR
ncbi:marine proteobacterial sortase target protein [Hahella sp. CCB-MM4]|uniref:marine proteobacterial sortase target protein n=1 Tax=Hahella sp. (strain CCB-MM4) TaxID=1926491 RepID=UPI000B9A8B0B|nr:marine proteobacterial sortase target protein [Hahella sp. CCB-MM4]OZG72844.1 marine proteobacterial sortase target protein [Hahella sp. CCB-MM4]